MNYLHLRLNFPKDLTFFVSKKLFKEVTLTVFQKVEYEFVASKDILLVHYNVKVGNLFKRLAFEIVFNTPLGALEYRF